MPPRKLKDGSWEVNVNVNNTRHHKRGFKTKKEAEAYEADYKKMAKHDLSMSFELFVKCYFEDKKNRLKERTIKTKQYMIDTHVTPYFTGKPINKITSKDIMDWQNEMIAKNYEDTYLRMLQNQVSALFNHATRFYGLLDNPCKKTDRIGRSNAKELQFWTRDEYNTFIASLDPKDRYFTLFEILFWTGMRCGEALALTLADIDFENHQINIDKTYYRQDKKDLITTPKTEKSVRIVDIPEFLTEEIREYTDPIYGIENDTRLFPVAAEAVQHKMKRYIEMSGVKKIRVHDLRHSHVAMLINMGVQPIAISQRLGHEKVTTTMNVYGHLYPNTQKELAAKLHELKTLSK